jgi:hypothetical protein
MVTRRTGCLAECTESLADVRFGIRVHGSVEERKVRQGIRWDGRFERWKLFLTFGVNGKDIGSLVWKNDERRPA